MPLVIRERHADGSLGEPVKKFSGLTNDEQLEMMGMQLAFEKLANMQTNAEKDMIIDSMGAQLVQLRIEMMALKGGGI